MAHFLEGKTVRLWFNSDYLLPFFVARILEIKDGLIRFEPLQWEDGTLDHDMSERENASNWWFHFDKIHSFHVLEPGTELHEILENGHTYRVAV